MLVCATCKESASQYRHYTYWQLPKGSESGVHIVPRCYGSEAHHRKPPCYHHPTGDERILQGMMLS